jgi:hypothetical protein
MYCGFDDKSPGPPWKQPTKSPAKLSADACVAAALSAATYAEMARRTNSDFESCWRWLAASKSASKLAGSLMVKEFIA